MPFALILAASQIAGFWRVKADKTVDVAVKPDGVTVDRLVRS